MYSDVCNLISERRKQLGLSLEEVGAAVGVSKQTVSKWEHGQIANMRRDKIALIAKILKLQPTDLLGFARVREQQAADEKQQLMDEAMVKFSQLPEDVKAQALAYAQFLLSSRSEK